MASHVHNCRLCNDAWVATEVAARPGPKSESWVPFRDLADRPDCACHLRRPCPRARRLLRNRRTLGQKTRHSCKDYTGRWVLWLATRRDIRYYKSRKIEKSEWNYLLDESNDLLDAFATIAGLAQDLDDAVGTSRTADGVDRDPGSCRLLGQEMTNGWTTTIMSRWLRPHDWTTCTGTWFKGLLALHPAVGATHTTMAVWLAIAAAANPPKPPIIETLLHIVRQWDLCLPFSSALNPQPLLLTCRTCPTPVPPPLFRLSWNKNTFDPSFKYIIGNVLHRKIQSEHAEK